MLISIITINFNNFQGLKKTMESVLEQSYQHIEYILIDGGSTDASAQFIEKHRMSLAYYESNKDNGVYHAMNKGIDKMTGDYVLFLNSGDWLVDSSIIQKVVNKNMVADIIYGSLEILEPEKRRIKKYPSNLTFSYFFRDSLPHSAGAFIKTSCFKDSIKYYDEDLQIVSDWKWYILGLFKNNYSYHLIEDVIGVFEFGSGISSLQDNRELIKKEKEKVLLAEFKIIYSEIIELNQFKRKQSQFMKTTYFKMAYGLKGLVDKIFK